MTKAKLLKIVSYMLIIMFLSNCGEKGIGNSETKSPETDSFTNINKTKTINSKDELYNEIGIDANYFWEFENRQNQTYSIIFFTKDNFIFQQYHIIGNKKHLRICEVQKYGSNPETTNVEYEGIWNYHNNNRIGCEFSFMGFACNFSQDYSKMTTSRNEIFIRSTDN